MFSSDEYHQEGSAGEDNSSCEVDDSKLPLQLAIVGRPNVGKSTLLNALLEEDRVIVGPEAGLTRDSIRVQFQFDGRTVYLVSTYFHWFLCFFVPFPFFGSPCQACDFREYIIHWSCHNGAHYVLHL